MTPGTVADGQGYADQRWVCRNDCSTNRTLGSLRNVSGVRREVVPSCGCDIAWGRVEIKTSTGIPVTHLPKDVVSSSHFSSQPLTRKQVPSWLGLKVLGKFNQVVFERLGLYREVVYWVVPRELQTISFKVNRSGKSKVLTQEERELIQTHLPKNTDSSLKPVLSAGRIRSPQHPCPQSCSDQGMVVWRRRPPKRETQRFCPWSTDEGTLLGFDHWVHLWLIFSQSPTQTTKGTETIVNPLMNPSCLWLE